MYMYMFFYCTYTCTCTFLVLYCTHVLVHYVSFSLSLFKGALRSDLIEQGAVAGLVSCLLHVDTRVQQLSLEAIALLSVESGAREQVMTRLL